MDKNKVETREERATREAAEKAARSMLLMVALAVAVVVILVVLTIIFIVPKINGDKRDDNPETTSITMQDLVLQQLMYGE